MFISKDSIIVDGVSMGKYLTSVKYTYSKLWSGDSGRNLRGDMISTLIGIYPKLVLTFKPLSKSELEVVAPILDREHQSTTYYDPVKRAMTTMTTYTGDYDIENSHIITDRMLNGSFDCSLIAVSKRR